MCSCLEQREAGREGGKKEKGKDEQSRRRGHNLRGLRVQRRRAGEIVQQFKVLLFLQSNWVQSPAPTYISQPCVTTAPGDPTPDFHGLLHAHCAHMYTQAHIHIKQIYLEVQHRNFGGTHLYHSNKLQGFICSLNEQFYDKKIPG